MCNLKQTVHNLEKDIVLRVPYGDKSILLSFLWHSSDLRMFHSLLLWMTAPLSSFSLYFLSFFSKHSKFSGLFLKHLLFKIIHLLRPCFQGVETTQKPQMQFSLKSQGEKICILHQRLFLSLHKCVMFSFKYFPTA